MSPIKQPRLLPHDIFFGSFLLITWLRLVHAVGFGASAPLLYLGLILVGLAAWFRRDADDSPLRWRLSLLFYPLAMMIVFFHMKVAVPLIHPQSLDPTLQHIDATLFGGTPSLRMQAITHPLATELLSACYMLFYPCLALSIISYLLDDLSLLKRFMIGMFTIYGIGFFGYSFVPAAGPYASMAGDFTTPLAGWWTTQLCVYIVKTGSNRVDVFPSLHCAATFFMLLLDRQHHRRRFRVWLVPCVGIWVSTIYLRYHYLIDVVVGFTLGVFALWLANRPRWIRNGTSIAAVATARPAGSR
ncbi:MAG: phosphatase PAP2 family protein [Tepidisphaeraceae bacterium]|jgi:membrane-associated phospholipid phosphatase